MRLFYHMNHQTDLPGWSVVSVFLSWVGAILAKLGTLSDWMLYFAILHSVVGILYIVWKVWKGR